MIQRKNKSLAVKKAKPAPAIQSKTNSLTADPELQKSKIERDRIDAAYNKIKKFKPPNLSITKKGIEVGDQETVALLVEAFVTVDPGLRGLFISQLIDSYPNNPPEKTPERKIKDLLPLLQALAPKNEQEVMLAIQMIAVHNFALRSLMRADLSHQTAEGLVDLSNIANKLFRTFTLQLEALNNLRGKGQQKVVVEHVHVNKGGQAIVGAVTQGGGSGNGK